MWAPIGGRIDGLGIRRVNVFVFDILQLMICSVCVFFPSILLDSPGWDPISCILLEPKNINIPLYLFNGKLEERALPLTLLDMRMSKFSEMIGGKLYKLMCHVLVRRNQYASTQQVLFLRELQFCLLSTHGSVLASVAELKLGL